MSQLLFRSFAGKGLGGQDAARQRASPLLERPRRSLCYYGVPGTSACRAADGFVRILLLIRFMIQS